VAERDEPVLHGELRAIIERLDERISSLDRNMTEMRADLRQMRNWLIGLYMFILAVAGVAVTLVRTAPPAS
jgi:chaperonin cofactor prefoldin